MQSRVPISSFLAILVGLTPGWAKGAQPSVAASGSTATREAAAEALFDQGKRLMAAGRFAEACASFEESERADHGVGTLLNLADCYEQNGQTASAWLGFRAAAAAASTEGQAERERIAHDREQRLKPLLVKLTIMIHSEDVAPGLVVERDDLALDKSLWGVAVPVDPGEHKLHVSAPGKRAYERVIKVPKWSVGSITVTVPPLEDQPRAPSTPAPVPAPAPVLGGQRLAGIAVGTAGLAGVVLGSALGAHAISKNQASVPHCDPNDHCDQQGVDLRSDARTAGTASTVAFLVAGAALAAGATLFLMAPKRARASTPLAVSVTPSGAGILMGATW